MMLRLVRLLFCFLLLSFANFNQAVSGEYYINVEGKYVSKSNIFLEKDDFRGIYAVYGEGVSYFILGFIESYFFGDDVVSLDDNGSNFIFLFSSSESDFEKISNYIKSSNYFHVKETYDYFLKNRDCFIIGVPDVYGSLLSLSMYVVDGSYYNYYKCVSNYYDLISEFSSR